MARPMIYILVCSEIAPRYRLQLKKRYYIIYISNSSYRKTVSLFVVVCVWVFFVFCFLLVVFVVWFFVFLGFFLCVWFFECV